MTDNIEDNLKNFKKLGVGVYKNNDKECCGGKNLSKEYMQAVDECFEDNIYEKRISKWEKIYDEEEDLSHEKMLDLYGFEIYEECCDDTEDVVNHPSHYNLGEIQTLDYIDDVLIHNPQMTALDGFYFGTSTKYVGTRLGNKGEKVQDLKKAQFYVNRWVEHYETD